MDQDQLTLAESFQRNGYSTIAIHDGGQLAVEFGLSQGFQAYETAPAPGRFLSGVRAALQHLDSRLAENNTHPFFMFLHTYEVHHAYEPREELWALFDTGYDGPLPRNIDIDTLRKINRGELNIDDRDLAHIVNTYDAEIRSVDDALGKLLSALADRGLLDSSIILVTSDHGEEFGEHGMVGWHAHTLYEELLRVPLIVRLPGGTHGGARVTSRVQLIDVAPTLAELAGLEISEDFEGLSLFDEEGVSLPPQRPAVAFWDSPEVLHESLTLGTWKLNDGQLYNLARDPGETVDRSSERPDLATALRQTLEEIRDLHLPGSSALGIDLSEETQRQLRRLGYTN